MTNRKRNFKTAFFEQSIDLKKIKLSEWLDSGNGEHNNLNSIFLNTENNSSNDKNSINNCGIPSESHNEHIFTAVDDWKDVSDNQISNHLSSYTSLFAKYLQAAEIHLSKWSDSSDNSSDDTIKLVDGSKITDRNKFVINNDFEIYEFIEKNKIILSIWFDVTKMYINCDAAHLINEFELSSKSLNMPLSKWMDQLISEKMQSPIHVDVHCEHSNVSDCLVDSKESIFYRNSVAPICVEPLQDGTSMASYNEISDVHDMFDKIDIDPQSQGNEKLILVNDQCINKRIVYMNDELKEDSNSIHTIFLSSDDDDDDDDDDTPEPDSKSSHLKDLVNQCCDIVSITNNTIKQNYFHISNNSEKTQLSDASSNNTICVSNNLRKSFTRVDDPHCSKSSSSSETVMTIQLPKNNPFKLWVNSSSTNKISIGIKYKKKRDETSKSNFNLML